MFGFTGVVGSSFLEFTKNEQNYLFTSRKKTKNCIKWNLNKNLSNFPIKEFNTCFFFSSPRILKKNMNKETFHQEYLWLKNVINNLKIKKLIYLSSPSIYYNKNHPVGSIKKKCEKFILKNKKKFSYFQIWRPYNLISSHYSKTDHFHNILFKAMFIQKKKSFTFNGNGNDMRGYSDVNDFIKVLYNYSLKNISFIKEYGNRNLINMEKIVKLFNKHYLKLNKNSFNAKFKKNRKNTLCIKIKKNCIYSKKKSISILNQYLDKSLNEKKVQHL